MSTPASTAHELTLSISQEVRVNASLEATFAAILDEMGPRFAGEDGKPLRMKIEARPGGRWYRDLGDDNGHLWGHVQAIKRPLCWSSPAHCSCPMPRSPISSTG